MNILQFILYFIGELYGAFCVISGYAIICSKEMKKLKLKRIVVILLIGTILLLTNNLYNLTQFRTIMSLLIMILLNYFCFKDNIKTVLINSIIYLFVIIALEVIFSSLILTNYNNIENFNSTGTIVKVLFTILIFTVANTIFMFINKKKLEKIVIFSRKYITVETLLIFIILILNILTFLLGNKMNSLIYIITTIISIVYLFTTILIIIKNKYNIEMLMAKNEELTNSYKAYSKALDQFRELKHNLKNDLYSIKGTMPKEKQQLLNNIITKYNSEYEWLNTLEIIPEGLEGIIYLKKNEAEKQKVNLIINYRSKNKIHELDFLDVCDILGIFLDNAIEASKTTRKKVVLLEVFDDENITMKITNIFNNTIDINKIGNKDYSTKEEKSGIGLYYINKIKNKNIITSISIVNNLFISTIKYKKLQ